MKGVELKVAGVKGGRGEGSESGKGKGHLGRGLEPPYTYA